MVWTDIVGHRETIAVLQRLVAAGSVPHAALLAGPGGIGKGLLARTLAAAVLCQAADGQPCGACTSCRRLAAAAHPDFNYFEGNGESLKIEQMRELQSAVALAPVLGERRVVIIEDAERLTLPAANSLLKILEEPSPSLLFILTAGSVHNLLNTIVSRCRVFQLAPVAADVLVEKLVQDGCQADAAAVAARLSGGRLGRAKLLLAPEGLAARELAMTVLRQLPAIDTLIGWNEVVRLDGAAASALSELTEQLAYLFRDMLLLRGESRQLVFNSDLAAELSVLAGGWSEIGLDRALREVMEVWRALAGNANSRLLVESMLLRLREYYTEH
ncbi:MAG: DNA polymerase III subunit delta' [Sporomusaceae bacterium]|nr:DNA polymerase III subunit delta' [Sporomusaceae bacterium]